MVWCVMPDLVNCALHIPGVGSGHGLQGNRVLTAHFQVSNLHHALEMLLDRQCVALRSAPWKASGWLVLQAMVPWQKRREHSSRALTQSMRWRNYLYGPCGSSEGPVHALAVLRVQQAILACLFATALCGLLSGLQHCLKADRTCDTHTC